MQIREIDVHQAHAAGGEGALLLDVREPGEWVLGHAADAVHLPLADVVAGAAFAPLDSLPPGARVVAVCRSGNRSGQAAVVLAGRGFDVVNMGGGMNAWAAAGLPMVDDDGRPGEVG